MRKRPELIAGDVCRLSKSGKRMYVAGLAKSVTLVVTKVVESSRYQNTSDGRARIECVEMYNTVFRRLRGRKHVLNRRHLWFTGYNAYNHTIFGSPVSKSNFASRQHTTQKSQLANGSARFLDTGLVKQNMVKTCESRKPSGPQNNNGQANCLKCGQPTTITRGFMSDYHMCENPSCEWYKN